MAARAAREDAGVALRPPAFGALTKSVRSWIGFAGAVAGGCYVAALLSLAAHEVLGHGLTAVLCGGTFESFEVRANLTGWAWFTGVPDGDRWEPLWGGIAVEAVIGALAYLLFRGSSRALGTWSLVLFWATAVPLGAALAYPLQGAIFGAGDAASLADLAFLPRAGVVLGLLAALLILLRWVVSRALRWIEEQFEPADARQRSTAFVLAAVLPLAALLASLAKENVLPLATWLAFWGAAIGVLGAYGAWRARNPPADFDPWVARRVNLGKGLGWFATAATACLAVAFLLPSPVVVGWRKSTSIFGDVVLPSPEPQSPRTFEPRYPRVETVAGLVDAPVVLPRMRGTGRTLAFSTWFDGQHVLVRTAGRECVALAEGMAPVGSLRADDDIVQMVLVHRADGEALAALLTRRDAKGGYEGDVRAVGADGRERWTWHAPGRFPKSLAVLRDDAGPSGVLVGVGGATGLVALAPDGRPVWDVPRKHVVYGTRSHPALPGRALLVSGDPELYEGTDAAAGPRVALAGRHERFVTEGLLFPDHDGRPALALAGTLYEEDEPFLVRVDENGAERWRARLPSEPDGLEMLEPPGLPRLLVATTDGGDLLLLDEDGTLLAQERLREATPGTRTATYALAAGRLGTDSWSIAVALLHDTYLYRIHPERIPAR